MAWFKHLRRDRTGSAAVEFGLLVPLLFAVLLGIIQVGSILFVQNSMMNAARDAARRLAVGELSAVAAQAHAQAYLTTWGASFSVVATDAVAPTTDVQVAISLPMQDAAFVDAFGVLAGRTLTATVRMRKEE